MFLIFCPVEFHVFGLFCERFGNSRTVLNEPAIVTYEPKKRLDIFLVLRLSPIFDSGYLSWIHGDSIGICVHQLVTDPFPENTDGLFTLHDISFLSPKSVRRWFPALSCAREPRS